MSLPKTIFCDIDGVLLPHRGDILIQHELKLETLPGAHEALRDWDRKGYRIILVTGRRESTRKATEAQLSAAGIIYDILIMGIGGGERVVINDRKPDGALTTFEVCLPRNQGLKGVEL